LRVGAFEEAEHKFLHDRGESTTRKHRAWVER